MKNSDTVLVIGSNSFAANSLISYLLKKEIKTIGISRPRILEKRFNSIMDYKNYKNFKLDINKNINSIFDLILKYKPSYIIDFAAQGMVAQSWDKPHYWFQTNTLSKIKLHKFLINKKFLKKFINISTPEVYGSSNKKLLTNSPYNQSTPYAVSKASIDMSLNTFVNQFNFPNLTARFANFYGPYQTLYRIIPLTIHRAASKRKIDLHGGGLSKRFFIYSDDFSEAIYKLMTRGSIGKVYHFSGDKMITIKDLVKKIYDKFNLDYENFINITNDRPGKDFIYDMDDTISRQELKWKNKFSLDKGIDLTIDWYMQNISMFSRSDERFKLKK